MPYIPHTEADVEAMLQTIGVNRIEDLFSEVPENLRFSRELNIPDAMDESKLYAHLKGLSDQNVDATKVSWFLGAGLYDRFVPASVGAVISRGEYLTSYTPYQPEFSQGYLQTIYEFQSMIAELYGMEVANASMYDGSTSMAEAAVLAHGLTGRRKIVVSASVHPHYRQVLETYLWAQSLDLVTISTPQALTEDYSVVDDQTACVIIQHPNFFGSLEDLGKAHDAARKAGAMFIVVSDPTSMALLKPPGEFDADIVVGEGQPLGVAMGFGGPLVGLFACKRELVRRIPGRIVGRTQDHEGRPGYVMTLRTREQDIRREKATSNICTNEALMALAATVYMSALGKNGLRKVAEGTVRNTQYARQALAVQGARPKFEHKVFGEFVLELPRDASEVQKELIPRGIMAGLPLGPYYGDAWKNSLLVACTETRTRAQIDHYAAMLKEVL
ncbi:MAG TPA: aminomethyl-transferring glycine dehydrogenase subunit GcvPA [Fimbriimonadaceae bacterium]|nr:aminomethyl-transferring glycine dehydrogenase subunit GcvPA [Fimbriimonadaceae bacterium]HRJ34020.1 aminomethyl-transferring glycine dehydrogenase subunit GcvPA [Fimbriimonadaceae bacterium]